MTKNASQPRREPNLVQLPDGRWRARLSALDPSTGQRIQRLKTFDRKLDARKWIAATLASIEAGADVAPTPTTFSELADQWMAAKAPDVRTITALGYADDLKRPRRAFGHVQLQRLTEAHIEKLARDMADAGLSHGTIGATLLRVRTVLARGVKLRLVPTNVALDVRPPKKAKPPVTRQALPAGDAATIAAHIVGSRLEGAWVLTLMGLRRSEILALQWRDVDLEAGTLHVTKGRVQIGTKDTETGPTKSERGRRVLPLPAQVLAGLRRTRSLRAQERMSLGLGWDELALIAVDPSQEPIRPATYSDMWLAMLAELGIARITLHGARHASVSRQLDGGVPVVQVAAFHGHSAAMVLSVYGHSSPEGQRAAAEAGFAFGAQA